MLSEYGSTLMEKEQRESTKQIQALLCPRANLWERPDVLRAQLTLPVREDWTMTDDVSSQEEQGNN